MLQAIFYPVAQFYYGERISGSGDRTCLLFTIFAVELQALK